MELAELTRRRKHYASSLARDLTILQELRHTADYRNRDLSERHAARALRKAREFVSLFLIRNGAHLSIGF